MKVSREQAAANRAAVVKAASRLFRSHGFDGVGVAEITRAAGLTHGGFYGQFASKDALAEEACDQAFAETVNRLQARLDEPGGGLARLLAAYLSTSHRDQPGDGCPMAAYGSEIARQPLEVQTQFAAGVRRYVEELAVGLAMDGDDTEQRHRALVILAALVGGVILARATARADPELSAELLAALKPELEKPGDCQDQTRAEVPRRRARR